MINIRTATTSDWPALEALNKIIDYGQPESFMHKQIDLKRVLVAEANDEIFYKKDL